MISIVGDVLRRSRDKVWCRGRGVYAEVSRLGRCRRCHGQPMGSQWAPSAATANRRGSGTVGVGLNLDGSQLIMVVYANGALDVIMS